MIENPISSCLHPQKIKNKYTGETLVVPCGSCFACLNKKASRNKRLCELEEMGSYRYTYFLTLTYTDRDIPIVELFPSGVSDRGYPTYDAYVVQGDDEYLGTALNEEPIEITDDSMRIINEKSTLGHNRISWLCYRDIQLFMKRFRKKIQKDYAEKIRYYIAGEYGPTTFRAHWHLILFSQTQLPYQIRKDIYQIWNKGRIDYDRSKGGCVSYAAAYSNSSYALPNLYKDLKISPISRHSSYLGFSSYLALFRSQVLNITTSETQTSEQGNGEDNISDLQRVIGLDTSVSVPYNGKLSHYSCDKTFKTHLFISQFRKYVAKNNRSLLQHYRCYYRAHSHYTLTNGSEPETVKELVQFITDNKETYSDLLEFIRLYLDELDEEQRFQRLYRFLLQSKNAFKFFNQQQIDYIQQSVDYYNLKTQLEKQQEHPELFSMFFNDSFKLYKYHQTSFYKQYLDEHERIHKLKLQKKRFNELSKAIIS